MSLLTRMIIRFSLGVVVVWAMLFATAGTFDWWEGWLFCACLFGPMLIAAVYLFRSDPQLLERRMKTDEPERRQKIIIVGTNVILVGAFLVPGIDHRFGWSDIPAWLVVTADVAMMGAYALFVWVMAHNSYASRVIEVETGQQLVTTGPYAWVRHPMYTAFLGMMAMSAIALGSWWALLPMLLLVPALVLRIWNEEAVLSADLAGYSEYCDTVRSRVLPGIW
jgi:protein-S-isoprenylcysteine O-methyltransferase Ste14